MITILELNLITLSLILYNKFRQLGIWKPKLKIAKTKIILVTIISNVTFKTTINLN